MVSVTDFVRQNCSQSHLCICNTDLFDGTVTHGVYGFPHQGKSRTKSFWRAVASMYNIGPKDLIFLYRTKGEQTGCQRINGPFMIYAKDGLPAVYYDLESSDFPMKVGGEEDCKVRFLFRKTTDKVFCIADNYELVKRFETKEIWGYRHPAVMNIGAARKKSVTSFTNKQTILILQLIKAYEEVCLTLSQKIPSQDRIAYYDSLPLNDSHFLLNDEFLLSSDTDDEAFLYAYILRGLRTPTSRIHQDLIGDLSAINDDMLTTSWGKTFSAIAANVMMETIISPHLQEELDIVLMDRDDSSILFMEVKTGAVIQRDVYQAQKYLDLLKVIFPQRMVFANIIGTTRDTAVDVDRKFANLIRLVSYNREKTGEIRFQPM